MLEKKSRFKNLLIAPEQLPSEARPLTSDLSRLQSLKQKAELSDIEYVAAWIVLCWTKRIANKHTKNGMRADAHGLRSNAHGLRPLGNGFAEKHWSFKRPCPRLKKNQESLLSFLFPNLPENFFIEKGITDIIGVYEAFALKFLTHEINEILNFWEAYPEKVLLINKAISPSEVLDLQAEGRRCVTAFEDESERSHLVDGQRDSFEFLLHDLIHAHKFFIYGNTHPQHMQSYLQAICLDHSKRTSLEI